MTDLSTVLDNRKGNRYVVTLELFMFAETDQQVKKDAQDLSDIIEKVNDNACNVVSIAQREFGQMMGRSI